MIEGDRTNILVTSGYGVRTKKPLVNMTVQIADWSIMMSPEDAEDLAHLLLSCAEASINDAFFIEFMRDVVGMEDKEIAKMIGEYREWREKNRDKNLS